MNSNKATHIVVVMSILLISISISFYYLIFLPQKENNNILDKCINIVQKQEEEIRTATTYNPLVDDRGCFLEAGCMQGVLDNKYKAKFDTCNQEYYQSCLSNLKANANKKFELEKTKKINDCMNLYKQD